MSGTETLRVFYVGYSQDMDKAIMHAVGGERTGAGCMFDHEHGETIRDIDFRVTPLQRQVAEPKIKKMGLRFELVEEV